MRRRRPHRVVRHAHHDRPGHIALDALNALVAAMLTAFGAFVPVYLAGQAWTQAQIGLVLTLETLAAMAFQVPGGAVLDLTRRHRLLLGATIVAIALAAATLATMPARLPVILALLVNALAGCILGPAIAAVTLDLVRRRDLGERLGRNVRFASIGSGLGAAAMGACASALSERAVFLLAVSLAPLALWAVTRLQGYRARRGHGAAPAEPMGSMGDVLRDRRMQVFAACVVLFHFASAAILLVAATEVTRRAGMRAGLVIAAFIIVPQAMVALFSPLVGRLGERIGRRPLLIVGFASLPLRATLFALVEDPFALVLVQVLEGVASAVYGVMLPLVAADLTRETGRYTLALGVLGLAGTLGAALSTATAGLVATSLGVDAAFWMLAASGVAATGLVLLAMPETRLSTRHRVG